jgi:hypothetical protein
MSMHFDVAVAFDLKPSTPQQVLNTISYLVRTQDYALSSPPDDPFFELDGWQNVFQSKPDATYCPGDLYKTFRSAYRFTRQNVKHYPLVERVDWNNLAPLAPPNAARLERWRDAHFALRAAWDALPHAQKSLVPRLQ